MFKGRNSKIPTIVFSTNDPAVGTWQYPAAKYQQFCDVIRLAWLPDHWAQCPEEPVEPKLIRKLQRQAARRRGELPPKPAPPVRAHKTGSKLALTDGDRLVQLDDEVRNQDFVYNPRTGYSNVDIPVNLQVIAEARRFRILNQQYENRLRLEAEELAAARAAEETAVYKLREEQAAAVELEKQRAQLTRETAWAREEQEKLQDPEYVQYLARTRMQSYPQGPAPVTHEMRPQLPQEPP
jgi:hypothetical protein